MRAQESLEKQGAFNRSAFEKLSSLLRYVSGDYGEAATFQATGKSLGPRSGRRIISQFHECSLGPLWNNSASRVV